MQHGTRLMYRERKCRCDECRAWNTAQHRAYDQKIRERDGVSLTQKYRPRETRRRVGACSDCGKALARTALDEPLCNPCRLRDKRGIYIRPADRLAIYDRDGWVCGFCCEPVDSDARHPDPWAPSLDHIVPRSKGGSDDAGNLRLVHRYCNGVRSNKDALTLAELTA